MNRIRSGQSNLGLDVPITRRDFINGALAGTACLGVPPRASAQSLDGSWTGPGGTGDYRLANGNTHDVVNAAHAVRDGAHDEPYSAAPVEDPRYDLVVIGGGITGLLCAFEHLRARGGNARCLVLENHRMFGGEARGNVIEVAGHRLEGPQGSNAFAVPSGGLPRQYWTDLAIPEQYLFHELHGAHSSLQVPRDHYGPMLWTADSASVGYWFRAAAGSDRGSWRQQFWQSDPGTLPLPAAVHRDLLRWRDSEELITPPGVAQPPAGNDLFAWRQATEQSGVARWLDSLSYGAYLEQVMGLSPEVTRFVDPVVAVGLSGTGADAVSAYAAQRILLPGVTPRRFQRLYEQIGVIASPIGNAMVARYIVKALVPDSIPGSHDLEPVLRHRIDAAALDRPGAPVRLRLAATAARVEHEGSPALADTVRVTYVRDGQPAVVRARAVVMAGGGWINRRVARDLPDSLHAAYRGFQHGPVLTVNVALRHWRFMDRLGIAAARWFDGPGFFANFIEPMRIGRDDAPLDPAKPVMLTLYMPFLSPGLPAAAQCAAGRARLFGLSYYDIERQVRRQLQQMFGGAGFVARRDVAGLVANRWGHAFICPEPGFFFGRDGRRAERDVVREGYGRVRFAHAELQGNQSILSAMVEARRASEQVAGLL